MTGGFKFGLKGVLARASAGFEVNSRYELDPQNSNSYKTDNEK